MKRFFALICILLLCGCGRDEGPATEPGQAQTEPAVSMPVETPPAQTLPAETAPVHTDPQTYTIALHAAVPIFAGPSYDEIYLQAVGEDGVYTIVEEAADAEGNTWGRLKSGAGWVDLTALDEDAAVTVAFGDEAFAVQNCHIYISEESEYLTRLVFRALEPVTDVELSLLEPDPEDWTAYTVYETLYTLPALEPGTPLAAEVVFYGDLTAYGLRFAEQDGTVRCFAVTISGRNGAPVFTEYTPEQ